MITLFRPPRGHVAASFRTFQHALELEKAISELLPCAKGPGRRRKASNEKFSSRQLSPRAKEKKKLVASDGGKRGVKPKKKLDLLLLVEKKNSSSYPRRRLPEQASLEPSRKVREPRSIVIGLVGLLGVEAGVAVCVLSGSERREKEV